MLALALTMFKAWAAEAALEVARRSPRATTRPPAAAAFSVPPPAHQILAVVLPEKDGEGDAAPPDVVELGGCTAQTLTMAERVRLQWLPMRRVCTIVAAQVLVTIVVVGVFISRNSALLKYLDSHRDAGFAFLVVACIASYLAMMLVVCLRRCRVMNVLLLALHTLIVIPYVGLSAVLVSGKQLILPAIGSAAVVAVYTTCTLFVPVTQIRPDKSLLVRLLCPMSLLILMVYLHVQVLLLPCKAALTILHGCLAAVTFYGYFLTDMESLLTVEDPEDFVVTAMNIYLDVVNIFVGLLSVQSLGGTVAGCNWPWLGCSETRP